jgi:AcrR family transcriptional regulator
MKPSRTEPVSAARQRILETAGRLFYQEGLRATGIDRIIAESGVAKMSFYRHFPSKADLIAAFLKARHETWMDWFTREVDARIGKSGKGLEVVADVLGQWFREPTFRGCAFINTLAESGSSCGEECRIAIEHKRQLAVYLESLTKRLGLARPRQVAEAAMIVIEGTIVRAQMGAGNAVVARSRGLLKSLMLSATKRGKSR